MMRVILAMTDTALKSRTGDAYACRDCGTEWSSKLSADECEILDAAEARQARREKG